MSIIKNSIIIQNLCSSLLLPSFECISSSSRISWYWNLSTKHYCLSSYFWSSSIHIINNIKVISLINIFYNIFCIRHNSYTLWRWIYKSISMRNWHFCDKVICLNICMSIYSLYIWNSIYIHIFIDNSIYIITSYKLSIKSHISYYRTWEIILSSICKSWICIPSWEFITISRLIYIICISSMSNHLLINDLVFHFKFN